MMLFFYVQAMPRIPSSYSAWSDARSVSSAYRQLSRCLLSDYLRRRVNFYRGYQCVLPPLPRLDSLRPLLLVLSSLQRVPDNLFRAP